MAAAAPPTRRSAGTGRSRRAARASSASSSGTATATRRCCSTTSSPVPPDDRIVRLGADHLPGDHRPAGLRADFRQPDARHSAGSSPGDGDPLVADRLGGPDVLRPARQAAASLARDQPCQLPHRRRHHAVLHCHGHGVRTPHRAPRKARRRDRGHARGRGHQRVPDGDPDDHRPGLDRQRDAVGVARRNPGPYRRRARRDHRGDADHAA